MKIGEAMTGGATVCILAAGRGTRVGAFAGRLHKALLPLGNVAIITRIIRQFPPGSRFVVAIGHFLEQVRDYLSLIHPDLDILTVPVENIDGPGSGPGHSLLCCRSSLPGPFLLTSCDTLIPNFERFPSLDHNWIAVHPVKKPANWCTVDSNGDGLVERLIDKSTAGTLQAFIGIAGVADPIQFWTALGETIDAGEKQIIPGLAALIPAGLKAVELPWIDTGTDAHYRAALERYPQNHTFTGKTTDVTYEDCTTTEGLIVAKLFFDPLQSRRLFDRGVAHRGVFANVRRQCGHLYSYEFASGPMLSVGLNGQTCRRVLDWLEANFWRDQPTDRDVFERACRCFYLDKTLTRLDSFIARHAPAGEESGVRINGRYCPTVREMLSLLTDSFYHEGCPSTFHGDLHADNIVCRTDGNGFVLIDWRDSFADLTMVGDRYYDLAKFFHTLDLTLSAMKFGEYTLKQSSDRWTLWHQDSNELTLARMAFWEFVAERGYDARRVAVINALVFINMAPLYDREMAQYLYALGRLRLAAALDFAVPPEAPH